MDAQQLIQSYGLHRFVRRKKQIEHQSGSQLSKELRIPQLLAIGVGTTIGAGIFILIGTVAKERTGPALPLSFLVAGVAAALSALSYAELASRLPSAGSAYHYAYTCLGEGLAWFVGWTLLLEYTVSAATVARGVSPNVALFFGKELPFWINRWHISGTNITADPFAGLLIAAVTLLLCTGIKQSAGAQVVMTTVLVCVLLFVDIMGVWIGVQHGWKGYDLTNGYFPYGVTGAIGGAATLFFSYVGFDAVATTAEEVKNPNVDLPIGIGGALFICAGLYMSVSAVVVGIVPYAQLDVDTPISTAFAQNGVQWAVYIVAIGALTAMLTTLLGCSIPQPRILLAMSRDGLLPSFFSVINQVTAVPVNGALVTGTFAAFMAVLMDVEQLSEMVSVGTLLAFTAVALCLLTVRYSPPLVTPVIELPFTDAEQVNEEEKGVIEDEFTGRLLVVHEPDSSASHRRRLALLSIFLAVLGSLFFSLSVSVAVLPRWLQLSGAILGGLVLGAGFIILLLVKQDESHTTFGCSNGFKCPFVPVLPTASILVNIYLLVNVGPETWTRVSIWLILGTLVYLFYGIRHSVN